VRDEIKQTISAYQTLYESAIAFGMRKALMAEQRKADMGSQIQNMEAECDQRQQDIEKLD
jgi:dynein light intermediate chain